MRFTPDGLPTRVLAGLGLLALWGSVVLTMAQPAVAGLQPGHGHVSLAGQIPPHHHGTHAGAHDQAQGADAEQAVTFTLPRDGSVAASVDVPAAVAPIAPALRVLRLTAVEEKLEGEAPPPLETPPKL